MIEITESDIVIINTIPYMELYNKGETYPVKIPCGLSVQAFRKVIIPSPSSHLKKVQKRA
jgi:hypothetical protein